MSSFNYLARGRPLAAAFLILALVISGNGVATAEDTIAGAPRGVHLSITEDPQTTMTVTWFTTGTADPGTQVEYGTTTALGSSITGTSSPAIGVDVITHEATIRGLTAGQTIHYRAGSSDGWSPIYNFTTAPPAGTDQFRFVIFGDHGTKLEAETTTAGVIQAEPDLVLISGDVSYAENDHALWDLYFDQVEGLASHVPYMAAIGNHGFVPPLGTTDFRNRFAFPGSELFYSFDYGNVHFLIVQSDMRSASEEISVDGVQFQTAMFDFIDADLADANERRAAGEIDFIIMVQHHALYSNSDKESRRVEGNLSWEEQFIHRYAVDLLVVGHNHNYERSFPMMYTVPTEFATNSYRDPIGFIQVVTGGGGRGLYDFVHEDDFMPFAAAAVKRHHFTQFDVDGNELRVRAITSGLLPGQVVDDFRLTVTGIELSEKVEDRLGTSATSAPPNIRPIV